MTGTSFASTDPEHNSILSCMKLFARHQFQIIGSYDTIPCMGRNGNCEYSLIRAMASDPARCACADTFDCTCWIRKL